MEEVGKCDERASGVKPREVWEPVGKVPSPGLQDQGVGELGKVCGQGPGCPLFA